jgi:hypothetical protein
MRVRRSHTLAGMMSEDEGFLLGRHHPGSRRHAILDANGWCA